MARASYQNHRNLSFGPKPSHKPKPVLRVSLKPPVVVPTIDFTPSVPKPVRQKLTLKF